MNRLLSFAFVLVIGCGCVLAGDWAQWRGPGQNGISHEKGLISDWNPDTNEGVVWKNEVAGMSSVVVMKGKVYCWTRVGEQKVAGTTVVGPQTQEAIVCVDANTGKTIWEFKTNMYQTEVPFHRLGWGNVAADPATNRVYGYATAGTFVCLDAEKGTLIWEHQMLEEYGMISTFGGRTQSPAIDEDQVFLTGVAFGFGDNAAGGHRIFCFDKMSGDLRWSNRSSGRPVDAPMGTPIFGFVNGVRVVAYGGGDGGVHGFKAGTGEHLFTSVISKRGINSSVMFVGNKLIAGNSEELHDSTVMGRVVCLDLAQIDAKTKEPKQDWKIDGLEAGFASPTMEPDGSIVYVPDNKGTVYAIETATGRQLWKQGTGTIGRPSLVWADGKIYAAEANGKFSIIEPPAKGGKRAKVLSKVEIASDAQALGREYYIFGSPAVSNGRIYFQTAGGTFCIGAKDAKVQDVPVDGHKEPMIDMATPPAWVQVVPQGATLKAGESVKFKVRTFDEKGRLINPDAKAEFSIDQLTLPVPPTAPPGTPNPKAGNLKGKVDAAGTYTSEAGPPQAGAIVATVGGVKGFSRVRVLPAGEMKIDFEQAPGEKPPLTWVNVGGKFKVVEKSEGKMLTKMLDLDLYHLARCFFGSPKMNNYTMQADVMVESKVVNERKVVPDVGIVNSRYTFVLYGSHQEAALIAWTGAMAKQDQIGSALNASMKFQWDAKTWYTLKLMVQQTDKGAEVKGKAWKKGDKEPEAWTLEMLDPMPNRNGSPGLFGESLVTPFKSEIYYDNIVVSPNK